MKKLLSFILTFCFLLELNVGIYTCNSETEKQVNVAKTDKDSEVKVIKIVGIRKEVVKTVYLVNYITDDHV
jgi:hypothetical protein